MKLKKSKFRLNFWLGMTIFFALLWYLLFTTHGAIRRELVGKQWLGAIGARIESEKLQSSSSTIYTTNPKFRDENGKTFYFTCYKKNIFIKCKNINH